MHARTWLRAAPIALTLAFALTALTTRVLAQESEFTSDERRRLLAGELVRRNITRREGDSHLFGGTSWMRVRAPIEQVWRRVADTSAYPRLIPSLDRARVVEERDGTRIVYMHHSYAIASSAYYVRMRFDHEQHTMQFELDRSRPHDIRAGRGFITLSPYRGDTIVAWGMLADVGAGIIQDVFGPFLNEWLLLPPRCLRDDVEPGRRSEC